MLRMKKGHKLPLKTVYYNLFFYLIVIPILIVLIISLWLLNRQFKEQAIENIRQAQEAVIAELQSDVNVMSMRLSHLIYTNNNEILAYAAETDTSNWNRRYEYAQKLQQAGNLALEPVKDIISTSFYMKDGRMTYIKNEIKRPTDEIRREEWYRAALQKKNTVCLGSYDTAASNDLYTGGKKNLLILVFALAPDVTTDRSQRIEMVVFYQSTKAAERIGEYNRSYEAGRNKFGITRILDSQGRVIFSTVDDDVCIEQPENYTFVRTPLELNDTVWYVESSILTRELTMEYWRGALGILAAAILVLALAGYYSRYFLRSIVNPIEEISKGLRQVEEGNLEVHIAASGQSEVRSMIHQFNAMVRRLKALIGEYEEKMRAGEQSPAAYFASIVKGEIIPTQTDLRYREFFAEHYALIALWMPQKGQGDKDADMLAGMLHGFERNPRYASRCIACQEDASHAVLFYRIAEEAYRDRLLSMVKELQRLAQKEYGVELAACVSEEASDAGQILNCLAEIQKKSCFAKLCGENAVIETDRQKEAAEKILELSTSYTGLANALYIADEKNVMQEKERLFAGFTDQTMEDNKLCVLAAVLAVAERFDSDNGNFAEIFGQKIDYVEKVERITDSRSLKLWLTNYFAWIMDYSESRLKVSETDVIIKAKRYIADHYEDADLSLGKVAEYVELNEKYFTNRFTRETGENFSAYLTGLRMQKAKELLKTTTFKVYEIAEMVGYHNAEHFNRMFKKHNQITPAQYRKTM